MNQVELIRSRVVRGLHAELVRIRQFISATADNQEAVDSLHGENEEKLLARITDVAMRHMGAETTIPEDAVETRAMRAVRRGGRTARV